MKHTMFESVYNTVNIKYFTEKRKKNEKVIDFFI